MAGSSDNYKRIYGQGLIRGGGGGGGGAMVAEAPLQVNDIHIHALK